MSVLHLDKSPTPAACGEISKNSFNKTSTLKGEHELIDLIWLENLFRIYLRMKLTCNWPGQTWGCIVLKWGLSHVMVKSCQHRTKDWITLMVLCCGLGRILSENTCYYFIVIELIIIYCYIQGSKQGVAFTIPSRKTLLLDLT